MKIITIFWLINNNLDHRT